MKSRHNLPCPKILDDDAIKRAANIHYLKVTNISTHKTKPIKIIEVEIENTANKGISLDMIAEQCFLFGKNIHKELCNL